MAKALIVDIEVLELAKRRSMRSQTTMRSNRCGTVSIRQSETQEVTLLFDEGHSWDERILEPSSSAIETRKSCGEVTWISANIAT